MTDMMKQLQKLGIIPVVVLDRAEDALPLAERLVKGGLPCAEITFRTAAGKQAIRNIRKARPEVLLGAGTVIEVDTERGAHVVKFDGMDTPRAISFRAKLTKTE